MKKKLLIAFAFILFGCTSLLIGQTKETKKVDPNVFDEKAAVEQAKAKGLKTSEIKGYVQFLKNDFSSKKALTKQKHKHSPYETAGSQGVQETVIYLNPNQLHEIRWIVVESLRLFMKSCVNISFISPAKNSTLLMLFKLAFSFASSMAASTYSIPITFFAFLDTKLAMVPVPVYKS